MLPLNNFVCFQGISSNVMWPALVDLQNIYGVDYDVISYIVTCSSLGYLLGSLCTFGLELCI